MKKSVFALILAASVTTAAWASENGVFMGIQGGLIYDSLSASNNYIPAVATLKENDNVIAGRLFAGYMVNRYFGLEAGYLLTTNATIHDINSAGTEVGKFKIKEQIADLSAKGSFYMGDKFFVYAKLGGAYVNVKSGIAKGNNINLLYGAGIGYDVTPNTKLDASWTRYNGSRDAASDILYGKYKPTLDFFALGVTYKFDV